MTPTDDELLRMCGDIVSRAEWFDCQEAARALKSRLEAEARPRVTRDEIKNTIRRHCWSPHGPVAGEESAADAIMALLGEKE